MNNSLEDKFFNIIASLDVSGKPPLLLIMTAQPLLAASKLVLPNGSSHREQTTEILTFFKIFKTFSCFVYPLTNKFLCLKNSFSLGSSPITIAFQLLYLFNILIMVLPNIS